MSKKLTHEFIALRTKCDRLEKIKNLNLWGNDIDDITILKQMPNLEVVSLSVNKIKTLKDFASLRKLKELYLRKNFISDLSEVKFLINCTNLKVLWLGENPLAENKNYRKFVIKTLPQIQKLDDHVVTSEERIPDMDFEENTKNAPSEDENSESNNFVINNEENTNDSNNYTVNKIIESDDDNHYNRINKKNEIRNTESNNKKEVYSIKERNKKIKDKFPQSLSRNNSCNQLDEKNSMKRNNDDSLNDDENYDNYDSKINVKNQYGYNRRNTDVNVPAGQTRHFIKKFQNQLQSSQQNINKTENYTNNQNSYRNHKKSPKMKIKSHNILSSILLLIQEMNPHDLRRARDEIERILK